MAIKEITDRIDEYDFFLICARIYKTYPKYERIGNVEVYRVGFGLGFLDKILSPFWGAYLARSFMKRYNIKLFWAMMVTFASGAPFLLKIFRLNKNIPILLTLQEGDSENHLKFSNLGFTGLSWLFAVRMADKIQVISNYLKDFAIRMGAKGEIEVAQNGVDSRNFQNSPLRRIPGLRPSEAKTFASDPISSFQSNSSFKKPNYKTVITVSRLVYKNGIDILIKAVARIKKEIPNVRLLILGGGEEEKSLKNLTTNLALNENVEFTGEVPNEKIYEYLAQADVFVRPSRSEGLGTAFLEAMASGLPIIATMVGGIPDFLKDGETGFFCKVDDPKDLSRKILTIFENDLLRKKLARNGQELVLRDYSWDNIALRMRGIFDKMAV